MLSISWLYILKCSCVVSECMWAVMFSFTYKWVLVVPIWDALWWNHFAVISYTRLSAWYSKAKLDSYRTRICALYTVTWCPPDILYTFNRCGRNIYWNTRSISKYTSSIAILLRTVSNVVIYVCDKHVTNIHKIISVGLNLSFRAHSRSSASTYYYVHLQISLDVSRFRICSYCIDFQKKSQPIYHNVQRITSSKYYSSCCSLYLPPCSSL